MVKSVRDVATELLRWALSAPLLALIAALAAGCSGVGPSNDGENPAQRLARYEALLIANPDNVEALRESGVLYFQSNRLDVARERLEKAVQKDPKDGKAILYSGLTLESLNRMNEAAAVYIRYTDVAESSPYRTAIEGRYRTLTADLVRQQIKASVAQEQQLETTLSPSTIAVFPLRQQGVDEKYAPLGLGLAEMMIIDFGQVERLKPVERIRIDAVMEELRFGQTRSVDPSSAPRVGRLLGAGRIVTGTFAVNGGQLRTDVSSWDALLQAYPQPVPNTAELDNLFKVQKKMVFDVLVSMNIEITPAERERIERIPTENAQAFLLYCIGLEKEDAKDFTAASVYYSQAYALDPKFLLAKRKADAAKALALSGGRLERGVAAAYQIDPPFYALQEGGAAPLIRKRLAAMSDGLGVNDAPGVEYREPVEEAFRAGAPILRLPGPPDPPSK